MSKRNRTKQAKPSQRDRKPETIEPRDEVQEIMKRFQESKVDYPQNDLLVVKQVKETAAAREIALPILPIEPEAVEEEPCHGHTARRLKPVRGLRPLLERKQTKQKAGLPTAQELKVLAPPECPEGGKAGKQGNEKELPFVSRVLDELLSSAGTARANLEAESALVPLERIRERDKSAQETKAVPEAKIAENEMPGAAAAEAKAAEAKAADVKMRAVKVPDGKVPDGKVADDKVADGKVSDAKVPDGKVADGKVADDKVADGKVSDVKVTDAKMPDAKVPDAKVSDAKVPDAQRPDTGMTDTDVKGTHPLKAKAARDDIPKSRAADNEIPKDKAAEAGIPKDQAAEARIPKIKATEGEIPKEKATEDAMPKVKAIENDLPKAKTAESEASGSKAHQAAALAAEDPLSAEKPKPETAHLTENAAEPTDHPAGAGSSSSEAEDEAEKYLTVKQVATILQVELSTLRFWEREFGDYLGHAVMRNQRKSYNQRQLETFLKIKELLKSEQYTIEGARRRLELDNILYNSLGVDHNFKTTVFIMLSAIMQELQAARQESRDLAKQVSKLQNEKDQVEEQLQEEQNKGLFDYLRTKLQRKPSPAKESIGKEA